MLDILLITVQIVLGAVVGLFFGRFQGREQFRYQKSSESMVELLRRFRDVVSDMRALNSYHQDNSRPDKSSELAQKFYETGAFYQGAKPWLQSHTKGIVEPLLNKLTNQAYPLLFDKDFHDTFAGLKFTEAVTLIESEKEEVDEKLEALQQEVDRVVEVNKSWWRKLLPV